MKKLAALLLLAALTLTACAQEALENQEGTYMTITAQEAKKLMDTEKQYVILDTRTQVEYDEGHIPGAVLIPYDQVDIHAESVLQDKDILLLVYCRSGRRSKIAAETLVQLGYTNVKEFGGIIDWPYEVE